MDAEELFLKLTETMTSIAGHEQVNLNHFLLPEASTMIVDLYRRLQHERGWSAPLSKKAKFQEQRWAAKHAAHFTAEGMDWSRPSVYPNSEFVALFPGAVQLTDRQVDVLDSLRIPLPDPASRCTDLNKSLSWGCLHAGRVGCFSSRALPWLGHRGRLLLPVEGFRIMGSCFPSEQEALLQEFKASFLWDLAGNALDGSTFLAAWFTLQIGLAFLHDRERQRQG